MTGRLILTAAEILTPAGMLANGVVIINDGIIESVHSQASATLPAGRSIDFEAATIMPSFIDVHIHGSAGHDVMEGTPESLAAIGGFLAVHGVGAYLATTVSAPLDDLLRAVERLAELIEQPATTGAQPIGIHLEGPFISAVKCGAHQPHDLLLPSVALFDRLWEASKGTMRLLTIAPELPEALAVIARAVSLGVRVSLGHSDATRAETLAAIAAGASSSTHVFNAMRPLNQREPGILGTVLDEDVYCELIADGIHVDPVLVRLLARAKSPTKMLLVTDAISATGMPDGSYQLGGMTIDVREGKCLRGNVLAGSVLTMDRALTNFVGATGIKLAEAALAVTSNPASLLNEQNFGALVPGKPANLTVLDAAGKIVQTFIRGQPGLS